MQEGPILRAAFIAAALTLGLSQLGHPTSARREPARLVADDIAPDPLLTKLATYRKWKLVNPTPQLMEPLAAISCARIVGRSEGSPHLHKYISVYVSDEGSGAMLQQLKPAFPVGSIIVKEKLAEKTSTEPELLTVMLKREPGYNEAGGNWEYLVLDGKGTKIEQRGKLASCNSCHIEYKHSDYVTRTYLSNEVRNGLK
ncbi:MAG: cytochrome P460 family protein [Pyrinomonadaceae bacterium]